MATLDEALARLEAATQSVEAAAITARETGGGGADLQGLAQERDALASEVARLKKRAEEDAALRSEAAAAVREALGDLRDLVNEGNAANG